MTAMRIHFFGHFEISHDGRLLSDSKWSSRHTRLLLRILLARHGRVVRTEQLLETLWPGVDPSSSRRSLHVRLSELRRGLGSAAVHIRTVEEGYLFDPPADCWIDVVEFEDLVQKGRGYREHNLLDEEVTVFKKAVDLYRGDFLENDLYADWADVDRERLRELYITTLAELAECFAQQGRYRQAIDHCRQVLAADPCREAVYVRLMLYHYYAGEQDQALRTFKRCSQVLADELGVEPMVSTINLYHQIREGTLWSDKDAPRYPPPVYQGRLFEVPYSLGNPPFTGRDREYAWLIEQSRREGILILVSGEAGVGKSRLVNEFVGYLATGGTTVLRARGRSLDGLPYEPVVNALRANMELWRDCSLAPATLAALLPLFPELRNRLDDVPQLPKITREVSKDKIAAAITELVHRCLPADTLLWLDDAHRADVASLELLVGLADDLTVVLTCRSEETPADHPLYLFLRPLRRNHRLAELELGSLTSDAVGTMLYRLADNELAELDAQIWERTKGNPLFTIASLQHMFEEGRLYVDSGGKWALVADVEVTMPPTMREMIEIRLQRLRQDQRRVYDRASVIGGDFDFALLQQIDQQAEDPLLDTIDSLLDSGLLTEPRILGRGELAFPHDCYAEVAYDMLPPIRRQRLHRKVGDAIVTLYGDGPNQCAILAHHFHLGGRPAQAVSYAIQAGGYALQLYAGQQATRFLENAVCWADQAELLLDPVELGQLHFNLGDALRLSGRYDEAVPHFMKALPWVQVELKQAAVFHIVTLKAMQGGSLAEFGQMVPVLEQELTAMGDSWALAAFRWMQGYIGEIRGMTIEARQCTAQGWRLARKLVARGVHPPVHLDAWAFMILARSHDRWANWRRSLRYAQRALTRYTAYGDQYGVAACHVTLAGAHYGLGEWDAALQQCELCLELAAEADDPRWQGEALYRAGQVYLEKGQWERAEEKAKKILTVAKTTGDLLRRGFGYLLLSRVALVRGAVQEALHGLQMQEKVAEEADALSYRVQMRRYLCQAWLAAGNTEVAQQTAVEGIAWARQCGMKREWAGMLEILGQAQIQCDQLTKAEQNLMDAAQLAERIGCQYDLAGIWCSLGMLFRQRGDEDEVQRYVSAAVNLYNQLGAGSDAAKAERLLSNHM